MGAPKRHVPYTCLIRVCSRLGSLSHLSNCLLGVFSRDEAGTSWSMEELKVWFNIAEITANMVCTILDDNAVRQIVLSHFPPSVMGPTCQGWFPVLDGVCPLILFFSFFWARFSFLLSFFVFFFVFCLFKDGLLEGHAETMLDHPSLSLALLQTISQSGAMQNHLPLGVGRSLWRRSRQSIEFQSMGLLNYICLGYILSHAVISHCVQGISQTSVHEPK
jgi:hypothetical protein